MPLGVIQKYTIIIFIKVMQLITYLPWLGIFGRVLHLFRIYYIYFIINYNRLRCLEILSELIGRRGLIIILNIGWIYTYFNIRIRYKQSIVEMGK